MRQLNTMLKRSMAALAAIATLGAVGMTREAMALEFGNGNLVLALYGNSSEYLVNLGTQSSLLDGTTHVIPVNSSAFSQVTGTNRVQFSLYGFNYNAGTGAPTTLVAGIVKPLSALTPTEQANIAPQFAWNNAAGQSGQLSGDGLSAQVIPASNPNSFTSVFGTSNTLSGSFPVSTAGSLGGLLNILSANYTGGGLSQLGQAVLALDGSTLTIGANLTAVPVPAAVVLFGTGLIGLVGIARRSVRNQPA